MLILLIFDHLYSCLVKLMQDIVLQSNIFKAIMNDIENELTQNNSFFFH